MNVYGYMDYTDQSGNRQRKELTTGQPDWLKQINSQIASTARARSPQQQVNGAGRASDGYAAQSNAILNRLTNGNGSYTAPKITHSLLTNEGFNEALATVNARNNAKLAMQNRRVLSRALGSLLNFGASKYNTDSRVKMNALDNETRRMGQKIGAATDLARTAMTTNEQKRYHDILSGYYSGQLATQNRNNELDYDSALKRSQSAAAAKAYDQRMRVVKNDEVFRGMLPKDVASEISQDNLARAKALYLQTGKIPSFKENSGIFDTDYEPIQQQAAGTRALAGQGAGQSAPKYISAAEVDSPTHIDVASTISKHFKIPLKDIRFSTDGSLVILPDGRSAPVSEVMKYAQQ